MKKDDYISILNKYIKNMNKEEKEDILNEYKSHFISGHYDNKTDEQISKELGNPISIAKELNAIKTVENLRKEKNIKNICTSFVSIMSLSIFNFIILLISLVVLLMLFPFILAYVIAVPVMIMSPALLIFVGAIYGFDVITWSDIFNTIKGVLIGIVLAIIGYYVIKYFSKLIIVYFEWNINLFKKEGL